MPVIRPGLQRGDLTYVDVRDYQNLAVGANWKAAFDAALTQAAIGPRRVYIPAGAYETNDVISIPANDLEIFGEGDGTQVTLTDIGKSIWSCNGRSRIKIRDMKLVGTTGTVAASVGGVAVFNSSVDISVDRVTMTGLGYAGVWGQNSTGIRVTRCRMHSFQSPGTEANSGGVILQSCFDFTVDDNDFTQCGGSGVRAADWDAADPPVGQGRGKISRNRIGEHVAYGVCVYQVVRDNVDVHVSENRVRDILGNQPGGSGGAGVYVAGGGEVVVENNWIYNCCRATANQTLVPGGIGVDGFYDATATVLPRPPIIRGNRIISMAKFSGIRASNCGAGVIIDGNTVLHDNPNSGNAIFLINCENYVVANNIVTMLSTLAQYGIICNSLSKICKKGVVSNNAVTGGAASVIYLQSSSYSAEDIAVYGNTIKSTSAGVYSLQVDNVNKISISGNILNSVNGLYYSGSTKGVVAANVFDNVSTTWRTEGACTNTKISYSNIFIGSPTNNGTGVTVETGP